MFSSKNGKQKLYTSIFKYAKTVFLPKTEKYFQKSIDKKVFEVYNKSVITKNGIVDYDLMIFRED